MAGKTSYTGPNQIIIATKVGGSRGHDLMVVEFTVHITTYLWVRIPLFVKCTRYNIMWYSLSATCDRSVVFCGYSGFLYQYNWPPRYNCNTLESGGKHHKSNNLTRNDMDVNEYERLLNLTLWRGTWTTFLYEVHVSTHESERLCQAIKVSGCVFDC